VSNKPYYDNYLDILCMKIKGETENLCYIDPPFNSKRSYNQIYNSCDLWLWTTEAITEHLKLYLADNVPMGLSRGSVKPIKAQLRA
jgi:hypothetical protein